MSVKLPPGSPGSSEPHRAERRRPSQVNRMQRPRMTDVTDRPLVARRASAEAEVAVSQATLSAIIDGTMPKGDVLAVAEVAGVMAGKRAAELIPLTHPLPLTDLVVRAAPERVTSAVRIKAEVATTAGSGVEMEALTAAAVAALTVLDMIKELEPAASIRHIRLTSVSGGEAGDWQRPEEPRTEGRVPPGARSAGRVVPGVPGPRIAGRPGRA